MSVRARKSSAPILSFHAFLSSRSLFSVLSLSFTLFVYLCLCGFWTWPYVLKVEMEFIVPNCGEMGISVVHLHFVSGNTYQKVLNPFSSLFFSCFSITHFHGTFFQSLFSFHLFVLHRLFLNMLLL